MFISSLSPDSLVEDPSYIAVIAAANPRLTTLSGSTLSRAPSSRFQALHEESRAALDYNIIETTKILCRNYSRF